MATFSFHHPHCEIRTSRTKGAGLFATQPIDKGEVLVVTGGRILDFSCLPTHDLPGHPFQVEKNLVLAPVDPSNLDGIFIVNHSCEPNAGIRGQATLVSLRRIEAGEEICYDYVMTDSDQGGGEMFSMDCLCGTQTCRGRITDLDWRRVELQRRYRGYFSTYLQARIDGNSKLDSSSRDLPCPISAL